MDYDDRFQELSGYPPYDYQKRVARLLFQGRNVLLRAPTGAGKTWAVLAPFFCEEWTAKPARLIYALPLRTLANGIYREARAAASRRGERLEAVINNGRETEHPFVTLQTGEQPDDEFFDRGRIIVTTYDQVLSGLLCSPYGLSGRRHNINAAAIVGALVVFDEFHLMPPSRAFLTAVAALRLFHGLCQSVWMTATATAPLEKLLRSVLGAVPVPDGDVELHAMHDSLPSVTMVRRSLVVEAAPLTADAILAFHHQRSIAIVNTVGRAQTLFEELRTKLAGRDDVKVVILHSRFFKGDRHHIEGRLQTLFGQKASGSAVLIATQVVEAGIDITCEHLHTELCPMNSLAQRAGRCARFAGEIGTVHVYPLPDERYAWLPYGDLNAEDPAISATRDILSQPGDRELNPALIADWIQRIHGNADEMATISGPKIKELKECIYQNTILRDPKGVAHLIRGENSESIRVVIADQPPESPGKLESIALSRWSIAPHLNNSNSIGWYWSDDEEQPWQPLQSRANLAATYAICLRPEIAGYSSELGLRLGQSGLPSPPRIEPPRPGWPPYREELWVKHARMVAAEAESRLNRDGFPDGLSAAGFKSRFELDGEQMRSLARACGLLHDLGKLQMKWQQWAERYQKAKLENDFYVMPGPLAHTDYDYDSAVDRARSQTLGFSRPPHAATSAFYALAFLGNLLINLPEPRRSTAASACAAAILAHHGAFVPKGSEMGLGILPLVDGWLNELAQIIGQMPEASTFATLASWRDKHGILKPCVDATTGFDNLERWWPLVAYLMRTLRLSDQRATSEWSCRE